ncbi:MAG: macro domain-containing protein [Bacteroidaceae bacterium]|nr:macro domain-containing protein [Bacteroidaceae bacterium]
MVVNYTGNVFDTGAHVICHQVNCKGVMGGGIALTIKRKYPSVFSAYKAMCKKMTPESLLGKIQPCICGGAKEIWIINMFAQNEFGTDKRQTDYEAFEACCRELREWAILNGHKKIAMPHGIGCGLAGGDWNVVLNILKKVFYNNKVDVELWKMPTKQDAWRNRYD